MKILYLDTNTDESNDYIRKMRMNVEGVDSFCIYRTKKRNLLFKMIQFFGIYLFSPLLFLIYGDWKNNIEKYDMFIVTSRKSCKFALKFLRKKTDKRIIVWYWNLITNKELLPKYCKKIGCETWTFDVNDAQKYGMKFNDTYYFPNNILKRENADEYDVFYCGLNKKGRENQLIKIAEYCEKNNLKYRIYLPGSNYFKFINKRLKYDELLKLVNASKAIIDLNVEGQSGMTLRALEAIFYNKLLITNNIEIVNYKVYIKENTFIVKDNNLNGLDLFINKKSCEANEGVKKFYLFSTWLSRITEDKEIELT